MKRLKYKRVQYPVVPFFYFLMLLLIVYFQSLLGEEHDFTFMTDARHGVIPGRFDKTELIEFAFT